MDEAEAKRCGQLARLVEGRAQSPQATIRFAVPLHRLAGQIIPRGVFRIPPNSTDQVVHKSELRMDGHVGRKANEMTRSITSARGTPAAARRHLAGCFIQDRTIRLRIRRTSAVKGRVALVQPSASVPLGSLPTPMPKRGRPTHTARKLSTTATPPRTGQRSPRAFAPDETVAGGAVKPVPHNTLGGVGQVAISRPRDLA